MIPKLLAVELPPLHHSFSLDELPFFLEDAYLLGGFAQSPVIIDINATESDIGKKLNL